MKTIIILTFFVPLFTFGQSWDKKKEELFVLNKQKSTPIFTTFIKSQNGNFSDSYIDHLSEYFIQKDGIYIFQLSKSNSFITVVHADFISEEILKELMNRVEYETDYIISDRITY